MLSVMDKYGPMEKLEELHLKNLSMGSVLILLPFIPGVKILSMKYSSRTASAGGGDSSPNLTDELFFKIFKKNQFKDLESLTIWCKTLSVRTADWFIQNCSNLRTLKSLSFWNISDDEQIKLWREGRLREPVAVEVDF